MNRWLKQKKGKKIRRKAKTIDLHFHADVIKFPDWTLRQAVHLMSQYALDHDNLLEIIRNKYVPGIVTL